MFNEIIILMVLIIINAFFAASEIALISLNDNKIRIMAAAGNKKAKLIKVLLGEPSRFLAAIQIGITLAGFFASAFAAESFSGRLVDLIKLTELSIPEYWLKNISMVLITLVLSYFTLILGELVPKRLAMKKAESVAMFVIGPLYILLAVTSPLVKFLTLSTNFLISLFGVDPYEVEEKVTEEEIRLMLDIGQEKGTIFKTEQRMINNIFEFNNKTVSDIMTHRTDIIALPLGATLDEVLNVINKEKYSRIPVYDESIDDITGLLYSKDIIQYLTDNYNRENFSLRQIIRQPYFVPASKRTDELFNDLQQNRMHIAIIIDEYGGTAGIATLEDLIEEIVGEIFDEDDDEETFFNKLDDNTFMINGLASLDDVNDYLNVGLPTEEYDTLSGFVIGQLGRIPEKNDNSTVEFDGWVFKVEEVEEKRLTKVKVFK